MKYTARIFMLFGFLLLTACATAEQRAAQATALRTADNAECTSLGFKPGTETFADCLLRLKEIRTQESRTKALNNARRDPFWPWYYMHHHYRYRHWR